MKKEARKTLLSRSKKILDMQMPLCKWNVKLQSKVNSNFKEVQVKSSEVHSTLNKS